MGPQKPFGVKPRWFKHLGSIELQLAGLVAHAMHLPDLPHMLPMMLQQDSQKVLLAVVVEELEAR